MRIGSILENQNIEKRIAITPEIVKKYISLGRLSVASNLLSFVNNELLPGTGVTKENFWSGLDKCEHELAPKNKKLLAIRNRIQKNIDQCHIENKGKELISKSYTNYLKKRFVLR